MKKYPRIAVKDGERDLIFLNTDEIIYCTSDGSYTHIFLINNRNITVAKRLKVVLDLLGEEIFVRIHHSHVVNLMHVTKFQREGDTQVHLSNGELLPVSKTKVTAFLQRFTKL